MRSCANIGHMRPGSSDHPIAVQILKWGDVQKKFGVGGVGRQGGDADRTCGAGAGKGDLGRGQQRERGRPRGPICSPTHLFTSVSCTLNQKNSDFENCEKCIQMRALPLTDAAPFKFRAAS